MLTELICSANSARLPAPQERGGIESGWPKCSFAPIPDFSSLRFDAVDTTAFQLQASDGSACRKWKIEGARRDAFFITVDAQGERGYLTAFAHGIGINNNLCSNYSIMPGIDLALRMTLAMFNDTYGREAFETLDKVMIKYWKDTYIGASGAQSTILQGRWIGSPQ